MATQAPAAPETYPVNLAIDYPDRNLNRLTSFFRIFTVIPIAIVLGLIARSATGNWHLVWLLVFFATSTLFFPVLLMVLFRQKYPKWWYDWNLQFIRFFSRVVGYLFLLTDVYPSTDEEQGVHFEMPYPDAKTDISQGMPIVKWFLAIPHYFVLACIGIAVVVILIIVWFSILFTGRYPKDLFNFVVGYMRWWARVIGYAFLLVTDKYPPFRFEV
jgi:hypothetical protein